MNLSVEIWIIIPTYNEAKNIAQLMNRILDVIPSAYLVIVDDSSPDGTAKIVCEVARSDERVHLLCRPAKLGYASAVVAGLQFALSEGASLLGYMDADLSHDPQALPLLVSAIQGGADLVIGSRYIAGGKVIGWAWKRKFCLIAPTGWCEFCWACLSETAPVAFGCSSGKRWKNCSWRG
jgi:Glycosyltransferases involved in cell wall biogenesis